MTQVWPKDDALTEGSLLTSIWPSAWISLDARTTATSIGGLGGAPTYSFQTDGPLFLHDGMIGGASVAKLSAGGGERGAWLWRAFESASDTVAVELAHYIKPHNNGATGAASTLISQAYVCARVSGGSEGGEVAKPWGVERWLSIPTNGYFFGVQGTSGDGSSWILWRIKAGAVTTLAQQKFSGDASYSNDIDPESPHTYRMAFSAGAAGSLNITCSWSDGTTSTTLFGGAVNDASPVAVGGRCGFVHKATTDAGASGYSAIIQYLKIEDAGVAVLFERWERRSRADCRLYAGAVYTDRDARDMRSGWTGDYYSVFPNWPWMRKGSSGPATPGDRVMQTAQLEPLGEDEAKPYLDGVMMSQRLADYPDVQHRQVRARFSSLAIGGGAGTAPTGAERRWVGVIVRSTLGDSGSYLVRGGYMLHISTNDSGTFSGGRMELWRIDTDGETALLMATATPTVLVDTDYSLALHAFNVTDSSGNPDGNVLLKAYLGGVQTVLALTAEGSSAGLALNADGTVIDGTSDARLLGLGEGMRMAGYTGTRCTYVDSWAQPALTPTSGPEEQDQATAATETETGGFSGQTLSLPLEWPVIEETDGPALTHETETGHVFKRPLHDRQRRTWKVQATADDQDGVDYLMDFWDDHDGTELSFSWTPPLDATPIKARFLDPDLGTVLRAPGVFAYDVRIVELLA